MGERFSWVAQEAEKGIIFNIQHYAIHDGPGIRTTVFMKGCPLHCPWCSNPESQLPSPELMTHDIKCVRCHKCAEACPKGAITFDEHGQKIDRSLCNLCLECTRACFRGAITVVGKSVTVEEVVKEVEKDSLFYHNSGGGVTISGGEPLYQWKFVRQVLKGCREKSIHTAIETTGCAGWEHMKQVLEYTDLVLYDLKHIDSSIHKQTVGMPNKQLLSNLEKTTRMTKTWIRVPLIPGFNDDNDVLRKMAELASKLPVEKVSILPYHAWGESKWTRLGRTYQWQASPPSEARTKEVKEIFESHGLKCTIGS